MLEKYKRIVGIIFILVLLDSCQYEKNKQLDISKNETKINQKWKGKNVFFGESLKSLSKNAPPNNKAKFTIVAYYDGGCSVCYFQLKKWFEIMKSFEVYKNVSFKFILSGYNRVYLENNLKVLKFPIDYVQHDEKEEFVNEYKFLLDPYYENSAMLLDKDNKVLFIGNPTISKNVKERYIEIMSAK